MPTEQRMRLIVVSVYYAPDLISTCKYSTEMCEWLAEQGHDVTVITAPPFYPSWHVRDGYRAWFFLSEVLNGVRVLRCPCYIPSNPNGLKRMLHMLSFGLSSALALLVCVFRRPDAIVCVQPFTSAFPSWFAARICGAAAWMHIQDFEMELAATLGLLPRWLTNNMNAFEGWMLRRFDRVSTISDAMMFKLAAKGVPQQRSIMFPNWVDESAIHPLDDEPLLRRELGYGLEDCVCLYSGNMARKQGLDLLLSAAVLCSDAQHIKFLLCGEGPTRRDLETLATSMKLTNVTFSDLQPTDRLNELLNTADIHLLPQKADVADLVLPSKLTGMLASGRPVVATARTGTDLACIVTQCGRVVPPGSAVLLVAAIKELADSPNLRLRLGMAARKFAEENFGKVRILKTFEQDLKMCCHVK